ncbi:MAG: cysteine desulfurase family protein [Stappiaceae bacterium]
MNGAARRIYLDHNASAPLRPAAREAMLTSLDNFGNASSVHSEGREARAHLTAARNQLADLVSADPNAIIFTSGCTEANVTVLTPDYLLGSKELGLSKLLIGASEHPSVLSGGRFSQDTTEIVPVDENGMTNLSLLKERLDELTKNDRRVLVSIMAANNETGVIQPSGEIAEIVKSAGGIFHVDGTQILGRCPATMATLGCDVMTVSAHKLGGPKGAGAIIIAGGVLRMAPLVTGGGQETYRRSGTENIAAIAGFGAAAKEVSENVDEPSKITAMRDWLEAELRAISPDIVFFGSDVDRIGNTSCFAVPGVSAETAVIACDLEGVAVSSGSACSSGKVSASHVLGAMGVPADLARGAIRVSLGWSNTQEDVERFADIWRSVTKRFRPQATGEAA